MMLSNSYVFNVPNVYNVCKGPFVLRTCAAPAPFDPRSHLDNISDKKDTRQVAVRVSNIGI